MASSVSSSRLLAQVSRGAARAASTGRPIYARGLQTATRSNLAFQTQRQPKAILPRFLSIPQSRWNSTTSAPSRTPSSSTSRSTEAPEPTLYEFDDVKALTESPDADTVLIDVREPAEYAAGYIPTAHNMPVKTRPEALSLPEDEFEDAFGFPKPADGQTLVFYCRSGVRSTTAAGIAGQAGYSRLGNYKGSWLDWEAKGGKVQT